jgi:HSP20 family protein
MTLVKFKRPRLPWYDTMFTDLLGTDRLLTNDLFLEDKWVPAMNVKELDDHFEIEIAAPGFDKKDFEISIENGMLKISAEQKVEKEKKEDDYTRREFNYSSFYRSFTLPENVNQNEMIDATYKRGILKLVLNKLHVEEVAPKRVIEVH